MDKVSIYENSVVVLWAAAIGNAFVRVFTDGSGLLSLVSYVLLFVMGAVCTWMVSWSKSGWHSYSAIGNVCWLLIGLFGIFARVTGA